MVPAAQNEIVFYATLAAITTFIPMPFLDDFLEQQIRQRMIQRLMQVHHFPPDKDRAGRAAGRPRKSRIFKLSRKAAMIPMRRVLRRTLLKTFLLLDVKMSVDTFGAVYHLGYLFDYAFQQGWTETRSMERIRDAVDRVCGRVGTSPVDHAAASVFRESAQILRAAIRALLGILFNRKNKETELFEKIEEEPAEMRTLAMMLQSALNMVPPEYFRDLRRHLEKELENQDATDTTA